MSISGELISQPIHHSIGSLNSLNVSVAQWQHQIRQQRIEQLRWIVIHVPISAISGTYHNRPRAHSALPSCTTFALQEGSKISRRLVLNDGSDLSIVIAHFQRTCSQYELCFLIDSL